MKKKIETTDAEIISTSPLPTPKPSTMDFPDAMRQVIGGKRITRNEWNDKNIYGYLSSGFLALYKDSKINQWIVSYGDLMGEDWVTV